MNFRLIKPKNTDLNYKAQKKYQSSKTNKI